MVGLGFWKLKNTDTEKTKPPRIGVLDQILFPECLCLLKVNEAATIFHQLDILRYREVQANVKKITFHNLPFQ